MNRKLTANEKAQRAMVDADVAALVRRHGIVEVRKAIRRQGKSLGAPRRLNEIRILTAWAEIEFWRTQRMAGNKSASVLAACKNIKANGGLVIPNKVHPVGIGNLSGRKKDFGPAVITGGEYKVVAEISNLRRYHERGQKLFQMLPAGGKRWWREFAVFGCAIVK